MPEVVNCPKCDTKARVPEALLGREVRCPGCGEVFTAAVAPPPAASPPAEPPPTGTEAGDIDPLAVREPRRDAPVQARRQTDDDRPPRRRRRRLDEDDDEDDDEVDDEDDWRGPRRDALPDRGGLVLSLGITSIVITVIGCLLCGPLGLVGLGLGIPAWIMGQRDLARMRAGDMDARNRGTTYAGWVCGIVGTLLGALALLVFVGTMVFLVVAR